MNREKKYPIHVVADSLCPGNLKSFLKTYTKAKVNLKYEDRNCLHLLIDLFNNSSNEGKFDYIIDCIKILLKAGVDPNSPDKKSRTPFFMLLKVQKKMKNDEKHRELVNFFLNNAQIDAYSYLSEEIIQMMKLQNFQVPEDIDKVIDVDYMKNLLECSEEDEFMENFDEFKENLDSEEFADQCAILLVEATKNCLKNSVNFLVNTHQVDINKFPSHEKHSAAFFACSRGFYEILEIFLSHTKADKTFDLNVNIKEKNLLHEVCSHFGFLNSENDSENYQKCFEMLMACTEIDVNQKDEFGFTPLYYAIRYNNEEATKALMKRGYVGGRNIFNKSQFHNIKKETLREFLDDCITLDTNESSREQTIKIDFNFLKSPKTQEKITFFEEIAPLEDIANNKELRELLLHPVLSSFLYIKWIKLSILFYTNLLFYFFFMGSFISYVVLWKSDFLFIVSTVFLCLMIFKEFAQFYLSYLKYFKSYMNWFELVLIIMIGIVLMEAQFQSAQDFFGKILGTKTMRIIRGITILFAACEFLFLFGDLPNFSVSTHMVILRRVFFTFLKAIGLYAILIIGFAFCFHALFNSTETGENGNTKNNETDDSEDFHNFKKPGLAILKTIVMFSGELEAASIKLSDNDAFYSVIFVMFVFLISIVLLNLVNGLSVNDVFQIKAEGLLIDLCQKVHVLNKYEEVIMRRQNSIRCLKSIVSIFPYFLINGQIIIDQNNCVKLGNTEHSERETFMENFYNETLQNCIKFIDTIKMYFNIETREKIKKRNGFFIKIDPKIMERIKNVIEERIERTSKQSQENRMCLIEEKLRSLPYIDEKLESILKILKKN